MRKLALVSFLVFLAPTFVSAQTSTEKEEYRGRGQGYLFGGFGSNTCGADTILHFGGGAEGVVYKGLGVGGEIGYMAPSAYLGNGIGILSANGLYQFDGMGTRKLVPFVTGGYTLAFRSGSANGFNIGGGIHYWFTSNGFNIGGGIHYWFTSRQGLRVEVRDHVLSDCHFWQVRLGLDLH